MRIIDFHTHTFPDRIAEAALDSLQKASESKAHTDGTVRALESSMQEAGIDVSIVLPVVTNPVKASSMNNYAARQNDLYFEKGLSFAEPDKNHEPFVFSIGGIHPDTPSLREVLTEVKNLGLKGIKLHPDYYGTMFNDIRIKRIIDIASELDLFVITHAGMDIGLYPPICCTIDSIIDVIEDVRPSRLILAHMGGWMNWEEVTERLAPYLSGNAAPEGVNIYLDTAFSIGKIDWLDNTMHKPYHQMSDDMFRRMVSTFGSDKILFATDCPWAEQKDYVDRMKNMGLSEKELEDIFCNTADILLKK